MLRKLSLVALALAAGVAVAASQPATNGDKKNGTTGLLKRPEPAVGQPMTLAECLAVAEQRQPRIQAALHSLRAAELGLNGLSGLGRIADRFSPDLPVRRQQSALGLRVAQAEVDKVRQETVYDVCLMYFSHVYARQSEQTAADVVETLDTYYGVLDELLNSGAPAPQLKEKLSKQTLYQLLVVIAEVRGLQLKAFLL